MSNRTDFFQSAQIKPALPAAATLVLIDGQISPVLETLEIVWGGWPEFSWARLVYNPAAYPEGGPMSIEDVEDEFPIGKSISIRQIYNGAAPDVSVCSFPIFAGQIDEIERKLGPDSENVEIIARDFSAILRRKTIYGQRVSDINGTSIFLAGRDTILNESGKGNAASEPVTNNGNSYTVFCAEPSSGRFWSYAEVIRYLLCEYLPAGQLQSPSIDQLRALTEDQKVRDFDVTGLNLLDALHRCCERIGLRFKFVPRLAETGPAEAIVFYKNGTGRTVELNCQQRGEQFSISKTNISELHGRRNFWPITHKYIGQGDFRIYEATFELKKAWDHSEEDTDYDKFSPATNPDFYKVRNVYRKWCLNEAGDYSREPYNQGEAFDFSRIFQTGNFVRRRRRFYPTITTDKQGKSLGHFLQVSFDNGLHWWQYLYAFNNLLDECGIWLSSDQLDVDTWIAALKGVLRFRITASVVSDERLSCTIADGPVDSTAPVIEYIITLPRQFKYRKVSNQSVFANVYKDEAGVPDEKNDSVALFEFIRQRARVSSETIETMDVQTPMVMFDYHPGDKVTSSPESRDLFGCKSDNRSICRIERVRMDFEKQCTNLKIIRQRRAQL